MPHYHWAEDTDVNKVTVWWNVHASASLLSYNPPFSLWETLAFLRCFSGVLDWGRGQSLQSLLTELTRRSRVEKHPIDRPVFSWSAMTGDPIPCRSNLRPCSARSGATRLLPLCCVVLRCVALCWPFSMNKQLALVSLPRSLLTGEVHSCSWRTQLKYINVNNNVADKTKTYNIYSTGFRHALAELRRASTSGKTGYSHNS